MLSPNFTDGTKFKAKNMTGIVTGHDWTWLDMTGHNEAIKQKLMKIRKFTKKCHIVIEVEEPRRNQR